MKKFTTLLTMAFIALMSISFTSCDDDSDIAYTLDGTWKGNMLVEYGNQKALYSVIRFDQFLFRYRLLDRLLSGKSLAWQ